MQETGQVLEVDAKKPDLWHGKTKTGDNVTVNIKNQTFEISRPGMEGKSNLDVYAWLKYIWDFDIPKAKRYLLNRVPDPKRKTQPAKIAKSKQKQIQQSDFITIAHDYIHPITALRSYGVNYNREIMDADQQQAVHLVRDDWVIEYFTKSSDEILQKINEYHSRFKMIVDFEIKKCARCKTPFNWQTLGTFAYAAEKREYPNFYADYEGNEEITVSMAEPIFCDADFVICEKCLRGEYAPRYKALLLVYKSAYKREEAREEEQRQRDRETWLAEERERQREEDRTEALWWEAEQARSNESDSVAAERKY